MLGALLIAVPVILLAFIAAVLVHLITATVNGSKDDDLDS